MYLEFLREALSEAHRAVLLSRKRGDGSRPLGQGAYGDLTFQVDRDAEDAVIKVAQGYFGNPTIISEERGVVKGRGGPYLLLDPIDGSSNAKRDTGLYSTSLCVATANSFGAIAVGGVIDHTSGRFLWGDNTTVYENWSIASPSSESKLERAMISFDSKFYMMSEQNVSRVSRLMARTKYPRIFSTAALETAYVSSGRIDAYVCLEGGLRTFDCMPSLFLLKTAGCPVSLSWSELAGMRLDSKDRIEYVAAGNAELLNAILRELRM